MRCRKLTRRILLVAMAACLLCINFAQAKKPDKPGGGGNADYTIVDLPGLYTDPTDGRNTSYAERVADVSVGGLVHVLGSYEGQGGSRPCVWTVSAVGDVVAEDVSSLLDETEDINSEGIVAGGVAGRPALLLANRQVAFLAGAGVNGKVEALNNPSQLGVFQAVGYIVDAGRVSVLWDVMVDGTVLTERPLTDPDGLDLRGVDISDSGHIGGWVNFNVEMVPAVGKFSSGGPLQISLRPNPNPAEITGFWDFQIDDGGNLLGFGYDASPEFGVYTRAVIWLAAGGAIDLGAETGITATEGNGIALVDGVMQAVGRAEGSRSSFAYLYTNNKLNDLGPKSAGDQSWDFDRAEGINTGGMICGVGNVGKRRSRQLHGFLLLPNQP